MNNIYKYLFALIVNILFSFSLIAQQDISPGVFTINNIEYKVTKSKLYPAYTISRKVFASMQKNREIVNNIPLDYIGTSLTNDDNWKQLVKSKLGSARLTTLKQNQDHLKVNFYFQPNGKILNLTFRVKENTKLTLNDIATIDQELRTNYTGTFTSKNNGHQYLYWISMNSIIDFTK